MKVLRFVRIGADRTVNIDLITHIWSIQQPNGQHKIKIHALGYREINTFDSFRDSAYEDAKRLRDQLVGGWHDHKFAHLGPLLSVNPSLITDFTIGDEKISIHFGGDYTIYLDKDDSGYEELVALHKKLVTDTRDGGAHDGT